MTTPTPESVALDAPLDYVVNPPTDQDLAESDDMVWTGTETAPVLLPGWVLVSVLANVFMSAALLALVAYAVSRL